MTEMTPSEAFVETLRAHGVKYVFGIAGGAYLDALDLFEPAGIRFVSVQHEQNAGHMADGYSRVTNRHGVCIAQQGPGVTNLVTAVAAAYWAHSPVVAITPQAGSSQLGIGGFQEINQLPFFSEVTKFQTTITRPDRIAEQTSRAFDLALNERGPVQVNFPRDFLYGTIDIEIPKPNYVSAGAGGSEMLGEAVRLLSEAQFPVIIAGGGVVMSDGEAEVIALAEYLSAPVTAGYLHNDAFPANHPLACGPLGYLGSKAAMKILAQADVVLALGTRLGPLSALPQYDLDYWPKAARVIQVDSDARMLGFLKRIDIGICADAKRFAAALLTLLQARNETIAAHRNKDMRLAELRTQKKNWETELDRMSLVDATPMAPRRALRELELAMPEDAIVVTDLGNICWVANSYVRPARPKSFLTPMSFGNCGYGFPAAMGAKVAAPDRPVVCYVGDGAWGMCAMETLTSIREKIPVTVVILNNRQWGAEKGNQITYFNGRCVGTNLEHPDFTIIAKGMGARGIKVDHHDQVGDALRQAVMSDTTTVIEITVNQDLAPPFRRDAFKKPIRLLDRYKAYSVD